MHREEILRDVESLEISLSYLRIYCFFEYRILDGRLFATQII